MAILFNDAKNMYLEIGSAVLTSVPITMVGWFNTDYTGATGQAIVTLVDQSVNNQMHTMYLGDGDVKALSYSAVASVESVAEDYSINTWHHAGAVFKGNAKRTAYLDGSPGVENTVNCIPSGLSHTCIGRIGKATPSAYFSGSIAEAAIWNLALSDAEMIILADGYSPLFVRPENLVAYWPLITHISPVTNKIDRVGDYPLSPYGTGIPTQTNRPYKSPHPRILYPTSPQMGMRVTREPFVIEDLYSEGVMGFTSLDSRSKISGSVFVESKLGLTGITVRGAP